MKNLQASIFLPKYRRIIISIRYLIIFNSPVYKIQSYISQAFNQYRTFLLNGWKLLVKVKCFWIKEWLLKEEVIYYGLVNILFIHSNKYSVMNFNWPLLGITIADHIHKYSSFNSRLIFNKIKMYYV
jgi:hypothetical protein